MIPLRDNVPRVRLPALTYLLLASNVAVFLWQLQSGLERSIFLYGLVPSELLRAEGPAGLRPVLTSMFLHGGPGHLLFNLLFLWVFSPAIEGRLRTLAFGLLYLSAGVVAAGVQVLLSPASAVPMVGASGAIAGVLGAYLVLFPGARVLALVPVFFFLRLVYVPAWIFLGLWFLLQVLGAPSGGAIAWGAHIGGFLGGMAFAQLWRARRRSLPPPGIFRREFR